ncbi:MAG: Gfo/Idh/MocA family oxidoreductase [Verrucomicrobiales bacterium]|nr:Gfo/Idh/MocA family oxidoreductase [Verrucomicrobiales bacterium]
MQNQKVAVIGAGNWGKNLVSNFHKLGALACVAEASSSLRNGLAETYPDVELLEDYAPLLASDEIDAVAIATPVPTHHAIAMEFLDAGKDVFVEKPMTLTAREAEQLVETADANGRVLMVGHLLIYQPAIAKIKELLDEGTIGEVYTFHQVRRKLGRARAVENALWSLGVHDVAVLHHLVGEAPEKVVASGHCGLQPSVEDDVYLHLDFPSGIKAHLHNSWLWPENERRLTIVGSSGIVVYDEVAQTVTRLKKSITPDSLENRDEGEEIVFEGAAQPLEIELTHFLDCLEKRKTPRSSGQSGLEVIRILEAAAAS